jgi:hypothetical protein
MSIGRAGDDGSGGELIRAWIFIDTIVGNARMDAAFRPYYRHYGRQVSGKAGPRAGRESRGWVPGQQRKR